MTKQELAEYKKAIKNWVKQNENTLKDNNYNIDYLNKTIINDKARINLMLKENIMIKNKLKRTRKQMLNEYKFKV